MTSQIIALALGYFVCTAAAEDQDLAQPQTGECSRIYTQLMLSFTEVTSLEVYQALPNGEQLRLNSTGDSAYQIWISENPHLVAELRSEAQVNVSQLGF